MRQMSALGTTPPPAVLPARTRTLQLALLAWLEREAFVLSVAALYAVTLLILMPFALVLFAARRRGASPLAVAIVACACFFVAPWGWQLRAQSFASLLFVAVLALLVADSRSPSPRVFLVLPLLAVWA